MVELRSDVVQNDVQKRLDHLVDRAEITGRFDYRGRAFWNIVSADIGLSGTQAKEQKYAFLGLGLNALEHLLEFYDHPEDDWRPRGAIKIVYDNACKEYKRLYDELSYENKGPAIEGSVKREKDPRYKAINGF